MHPSSSPFSCRFSLIPNFTPVIIPRKLFPFTLLFLPLDLPICTLSVAIFPFVFLFRFPFSVFFVHLHFYSPSLYTFSRRFIFSSSLLFLKMFLQFLLSILPCKPFPVYLYLPVFYFHPFSSSSVFYSHLS
jgi:hypothetical protein